MIPRVSRTLVSAFTREIVRKPSFAAAITFSRVVEYAKPRKAPSPTSSFLSLSFCATVDKFYLSVKDTTVTLFLYMNASRTIENETREFAKEISSQKCAANIYIWIRYFARRL